MSILNRMSFQQIKVKGCHNGGHITQVLLRKTDLETVLVMNVDHVSIMINGTSFPVTTATVMATGTLPQTIFDGEGFIKMN